MADSTAGSEDHANGSMKLDAPPTLRSSNNWVLRNGKKPVNKGGSSKGWAEPSFWMPFDEALEALKSSPDKFSGLGYVVQRDQARGDNQIIGGDLDNCRDPVTGWVSPWAESFLSSINACTSISISGCGFRFFCLGKLPNDLNKITGHGPEDLTSEAMSNIIARKPEIKDKFVKREPTWNGFEIYESGPRHLTITGEWLPGYPEDLPNRASEILEVIRPYLEEETPEEPPEEPPEEIPETEPTSTPPGFHGGSLPFLSIIQVIDVSNFTEEGEELVGSHPILGSSTGSNLKVNLRKNAWYYFHAGSEAGGDAWMWLACESGAVAWKDCRPGVLSDPSVLAKVKQYAAEKGYFSEDELFQEESSLSRAYKLVSEMKEKVLADPGIPFDEKYIYALALIKIEDQPEFERIKSHLKGKVSWRDLSKSINEAVDRINNIRRSVQRSDSKYIWWYHNRPILAVGPLLTDIIKDLRVCVIAGTEKDLAIYNEKTGIYEMGRSGMRLILSEAINRIRSEGDQCLESITNQDILKIRSLAPALALEVDDSFEKMTYALCVGNGVVELRNSRMFNWAPEWFLAQRTPVNYTYGKDWRELAPRFNEALTRTFDGDNDRIEYFQRYMGYCATGETVEDSILILTGIGGVGKSTLIDAVREALGNGYTRVIKADLEKKSGANTIRDGIARARYARLLILKELDKDNNLSWGTLKELASNSSVIEARKLYSGTENFHLMSKLVIDTNFLPKADEPDRSIMRRLKPLPFRHIMTDEEKDPQIYNYIVKNELPGVLAWIIEGARKWCESGLGNPAFIEEELSVYKTSMDTHLASSWLDQSGYKVAHNVAQLTPEKWIRTTDLYADYRRYAVNGGAKLYSIQDFSGFLEARGARKDQKKRTIGGFSDRAVFWLNIEKVPAD